MAYHYFTFIPYFNSFVSVCWGSLTCSFLWVSINSLLMMIIDIYGDIIVICIGLPVVIGVVYNIKTVQIKTLLMTSIDKIQSPTSALIKILEIQQIIKSTNIETNDYTRLIGIINDHIFECQNPKCLCKSNSELFDSNTKSFCKRNNDFHNQPVYFVHFTKWLYEEAISKFQHSPLFHIYFSFYLFDVMKNVHASIIELNIACKKFPSTKQQFEIYRQKSEIENYIRDETLNSKDSYTKLINIIYFEELLNECQKSIENVANSQVEFWVQVTNQLPDLNILYELSNNIYKSANCVEGIWLKLYAINSNYNKEIGRAHV